MLGKIALIIVNYRKETLYIYPSNLNSFYGDYKRSPTPIEFVTRHFSKGRTNLLLPG